MSLICIIKRGELCFIKPNDVKGPKQEKYLRSKTLNRVHPLFLGISINDVVIRNK